VIQAPHMRGLWSRVAGGPSFSPIDNADVVEVYNAWDTSRHTYYAARTLVSYETGSGNTVVTCAENPTGFSVTGIGDVVVIASGDAQIDGEWTVTAVSGATFTFANPSGNPTASPVSVSGTAQWKHRKVQSVLGMRGLYSFDQNTLANAPQWDATAKEMLFIRARLYRFNVHDDIRNAVTAAARTAIGVFRSGVADTGVNRFVGAQNTGGKFNVGRGGIETINVFGTIGTAASWTDSSVNNGNTKLVVWRGDTSLQDLYVNDMVAAKASSSNNGLADSAGPSLGIGRGGNPSFVALDGSCNLVIFGNAVTSFDQAYRVNLTAWAESQGATFG
jgi:hypothetical protein